MSELRQRMLEDMQLRGLAEKTQQAYVSAVRQLAEYYGKSPAALSEAELRQYFLYLKNEQQLSSSGFTIVLCGIKFFYPHTLQQTWTTLDLVRPTRERKLPVVLSREEVQQILGCVRRPRYQMCLRTMYACGLRLSEGVHLQVQDLDSDRMVVHVRHGKGAKDRYVPLPARLLPQLRHFWCRYRHPVWLFPARTRMGVPPHAVTRPISVSRRMQTSVCKKPFGQRVRKVASRNRPRCIPYATPSDVCIRCHAPIGSRCQPARYSSLLRA